MHGEDATWRWRLHGNDTHKRMSVQTTECQPLLGSQQLQGEQGSLRALRSQSCSHYDRSQWGNTFARFIPLCSALSWKTLQINIGTSSILKTYHKGTDKPDPTPTGHSLLQSSQNCHQLIQRHHNYMLPTTHILPSVAQQLQLTPSLTFCLLLCLERHCDQEGVVGTRTVC